MVKFGLLMLTTISLVYGQTTFTVKQTTTVVVTLDGNLTEWTAANKVSFGTFSGQDNSVDVYAMWDTTNIYFAFDVRDTQLWTAAGTRDGDVWKDDAAEVFFDTNNNTASRPDSDDYQVLVNLNNIVSDLRGDGTYRVSSWDGTWSSAVSYTGTLNNNGDTDTGFRVEISVPFTSLGKTTPTNGAIWGCMFQVDDSESSATRRTNVNWPSGSDPDVPSGWNKILFSTVSDDSTAPSAPTLSSPENGSSTTDTTPTFQWTAVTDPSGVTYNLQVDNDSGYGSPDINLTGLTSTSYTPTTSLSDNKTYYWQVRAVDGAGNLSNWTSSWNVYVYTAGTLIQTKRGTPVIDGTINEWGTAEKVSFGTFSGQENSVTLYTMWDTTNIYFAFDVRDTQLWTAAGTRDGDVWKDDAAEVFFDTNNDAASIPNSDDYQVLVNLNNIVSDLRGNGVTRDSSWNATWTSAVTYSGTLNNNGDTDTGYAIEISVPFTSLGKTTPTNGTIWGCMFQIDDSESSATRRTTVNWPTGSQPDVPSGWNKILFYETYSDTTAPSVPTLSSPANNSSTVDTTPTLQWNAVSDPSGVSYTVQVSVSVNFGTTVINQSGVTSTSHTPTSGLTVNTTYYWRVMAVDGGNNSSSWSSTWNVFIETDTTPPSIPTLTTPANSGTVTSFPTTFDWSDSTDDSLPIIYELQISTDVNFGVINHTATSSVSNYQLSLTLNSQLYYWRVRAKDSATVPNTSNWANYFTFTVDIDTTPPSQPTHISPVNSSTQITKAITFDWSDVTDVDNKTPPVLYELKVDNDPAFNFTEVSTTNLSSSQYTATNLTDGMYYWQVRARDSTATPNYSQWTNAWTVTLNLPVDNAVISTYTIPTSVLTGSTTTVTITLRNSGTSTWEIATHRLGAYSVSAGGTKNNQFVWKNFVPNGYTNSATDQQCYLATTVAPNETYTFQFDLIASQTPGFYNLETRMYQQTVAWYGEVLDASIRIANTSDNTPPTVPNLYLPVNNASVGSLPTNFVWTEVTDTNNQTPPVYYDLQVDNETSFTSPINLELTDLSVATYTLTSLNNGTYFWRVRARDNVSPANYSTWSATFSFRMNIDNTAPPVPTLVSPIDGYTTNYYSIILDWIDVNDVSDQTPPVLYDLQLDADPSFSNPDIIRLDLTNSQDTLVNLANGTYYWRVRAKDSAYPTANASSPTTAWSFTLNVDSEPPTVPFLVSPINGATTNQLVLTLDWVDSGELQSLPVLYDVQVDDDPTFSSPEINPINLSESQYTLPPLLYNGTFYWRVRAKDNATPVNISTWAVAYNFNINIDTTPPLVPDLVTPINGYTTNYFIITYNWLDVSDVGNQNPPVVYDLQVAQDSTFSTLITNQQNLFNSEFTSYIPLQNGTYYWHVRSNDTVPLTSQWSTIWLFTINIDTIPPPVPILMYPVNGSTQTAVSLNFGWNEVTDINNQSMPITYELQISTTVNFSTITYTTTTLNAQFFNFTIANGLYYWHVRAKDNAAQLSSWTTTWHFIVKIDTTPPPVPSLISPVNRVQQTYFPLTFDWSDVSDTNNQSPPVFYELQIDTSPMFNLPVFSRTNLTSSVFPSTTTLKNGVYFWRIRARDSSLTVNYSQWSSTYSIVIVVPEIINDLPGMGELEPGEVRAVVKNPVNPGMVTATNNESIKFVFKKNTYTFDGDVMNISSANEYILRVLDVLGNVIYEEPKVSDKIQDEFIWTTNDTIPAGIYLGYIEGPGVKNYDRFIVVK